MQPWPPCAMKASAVESSPESWMKSGPIACALQADAVDLAGRVLDADDVLQLEEPRHGLDRHVDHRARRDVVDDDRNADRVVDRLEVLVEALLVRLVVIGRHDQHGVGARLLGVAGKVDRLGRVVGAGAGDHRHPALRHLDADFDDALVLVVAQRRAFAGRADRHEAVACPPRSASRRRRGRRPRRARRSRIGVTSAVIEPLNMAFPGQNSRRNRRFDWRARP